MYSLNSYKFKELKSTKFSYYREIHPVHLPELAGMRTVRLYCRLCEWFRPPSHHSASNRASTEMPFHSPSTSATVRAVTPSPTTLSAGLLIVGIRARAQASSRRSSALRHGQVTILQPGNGQAHGGFQRLVGDHHTVVRFVTPLVHFG